MILFDNIGKTTIPAAIVDGVLLIADHPLLAEDADELVILEAQDGELTALDEAGYSWRLAAGNRKTED